MTLALPQSPRRRRPGLTPMIDVVFLLLVFFMLAARFGTLDATPISAPQAGGDYDGPPRLVTLAPGDIRLNGQPVAAGDLPAALAPLMDRPSDAILIRPLPGATVQDLLDLAQALRDAGLTGLSVID